MCGRSPEKKCRYELEIITRNKTISNKKASWHEEGGIIINKHSHGGAQNETDLHSRNGRSACRFMSINGVDVYTVISPPCLFFSLKRFCKIWRSVGVWCAVSRHATHYTNRLVKSKRKFNTISWQFVTFWFSG